MTIEIEQKERDILNGITLPPRPKALIAITEESRKPNANLAVIARAIASDVSISAAVLKVVNSAAFRRPAPITAIDAAVNLLGIKRVLAIVNAVAVRGAIKTKVDLEHFWQYGAAVANACVLTCKLLKKSGLMDDAYTIGLFHDAGIPVMIAKFADFHAFYTEAEQEGWTLSIDKEREKYGTTHSTIGAILAQEWTLPEPLVNAIYNLHYADGIFDSGDLDKTALDLLAVLKCGREFARQLLRDGSSDAEWVQVEEQVLAHLDLDEDRYSDLQNEVLSQLREGQS
ncbi:Predicted signal transduction protein [gamma proteobacterium HdN1]|nr:Predicted signal transduction protein [gamma proteobacterium HdN1]